MVQKPVIQKTCPPFSAAAKKEKLSVKCVALDQYRLKTWERRIYFFVIVSTQGEGEPPETAKKFIHHIRAFYRSSENVKYSVLALGDTSYPLFCKTGEDVDQRFEYLGATRVIPIMKCDVDFEDPA